MPIGLMLCFGPLVFIWLREEIRGRPPGDDEE